MEINIKEALAVITYVVSIIAVFIAFKQRLSVAEKEISRCLQVIYENKGSLNVVDRQSCKENRDIIFSALRRSEYTIRQTLDRLDNMSENIIKILVHLDIKKEAMKADEKDKREENC